MSNTEIKEQLNLRIMGTRDGIEYTAEDVQVFDNEGKFNRKSISSVGLILGRTEDAIQIEVLERAVNDEGDTVNNLKCHAEIKDDAWYIREFPKAEGTSHGRTGTKKSGQKNVKDTDKKCDMRFDFTHVVQLMLKTFYPELKVSGSASAMRSKYGTSLIDAIEMLIGLDVSTKDITEKLQGDIDDKQWIKILDAVESEDNTE